MIMDHVKDHVKEEEDHYLANVTFLRCVFTSRFCVCNCYLANCRVFASHFCICNRYLSLLCKLSQSKNATIAK
jgi:hypothetical protein